MGTEDKLQKVIEAQWNNIWRWKDTEYKGKIIYWNYYKVQYNQYKLLF